MRAATFVLRAAKWIGAGMVLLLLGAWLLSPTPEVVVARGYSLQVADGLFTVRMWTGPERSPPGAPADTVPEGSIPDTRNLPLWMVLLALAVPTLLLWGRDHRHRSRSWRAIRRAIGGAAPPVSASAHGTARPPS